MAKKVLIAYYSRRGENYVNGSIKNLKLGNTEVVAQNLDILDFELSADDMAQIQTLDTGKSLFFDHHDGETTKMFMGWR